MGESFVVVFFLPTPSKIVRTWRESQRQCYFVFMRGYLLMGRSVHQGLMEQTNRDWRDFLREQLR